jgi:hypothetical protein
MPVRNVVVDLHPQWFIGERVGEHLMGPCKNSVTLVMHGKHPTSRDILYKLMDTTRVTQKPVQS